MKLKHLLMRHFIISLLLLILSRALSGQAMDGGYESKEDVPRKPLTGYVDMHAHPRGDLAYGTELFYGAPYGDISVALGNCKADHGAWGAGNKHGNLFRTILAQQT